MKYGTLIVEKKEYAVIKRMLSQAPQKADSIFSTSVEKLSNELKLAQLLMETEMPDDIVRLNTIVTIQGPQKEDKTIQIVMPSESNIAENKISILAPMGLALFGYAKDDEVMWEFPSGMNKIKIRHVEQQEVEDIKN